MGGCAQALKNAGARVAITEVDPICALQALMDGIDVVRLEDVISDVDIVITATGNKGIIMASDMAKMKNNCMGGNIGHFDNEIDMAGLDKVTGIKKINIKAQCDRYEFPDGHGVIILAEGRLLNLDVLLVIRPLLCHVVSPIKSLLNLNYGMSALEITKLANTRIKYMFFQSIWMKKLLVFIWIS